MKFLNSLTSFSIKASGGSGTNTVTTINIRDTATGVLSGAGQENAFGEWIGSMLSAVMFVAALLVLFYLIWGAIEWITAGGDSGKIQKARDKMVQAVLGILVLGATWAIFMFVQWFLGINVLDTPSSSGSATSGQSNSGQGSNQDGQSSGGGNASE